MLMPFLFRLLISAAQRNTLCRCSLEVWPVLLCIRLAEVSDLMCYLLFLLKCSLPLAQPPGLGSAVLPRLDGSARDDVAISSPGLCVGAAAGLCSPAPAAPDWCSWKPPQERVHMRCMELALSLQGPFLLLLGPWAFSSCLLRPIAMCQGGHS